MKNRLYGIGLALGLSLVFLVIFFGKIIRDPDNTYFSVSGDGFKAYYVGLYHVQYDTVDFRTAGMNYPFGEIIPYTDSQPPVINTIRFISENILDIRDYTVAILNLLMLFSVLLGALFICLILMESGLAWWYAALVSVGIAFLSPQIGRLGGHFSLAWVFWIPMMAWFIIRFNKKYTLSWSLIMGIATWTAGLMHFYFLVFFGFLIGGYWLYRFVFYKRTLTFWYRDLLHFTLQYILPVLLLQLMVITHDEVTDRPTYPFGFQSSVAHPVGIFFPSGSPWNFVPKILTVFNHISWESHSYIGTVALAGFIFGLARIVGRAIKKEPVFAVSDHKTINVIFWISILSLLFSFGIPFIFGLKGFFSQFGFIRQIRVLARFSWLFYYLINIIVFAALFHRAFGSKNNVAWKITAILGIVLLWTEAAFNVNGIAPYLDNRIQELEKGNRQQAGWLNGFKPSEYQAVIPMPYFHIGSENIWIEGSSESDKNALLFSLQTGLPSTGVILSRTSVSQTFMQDAVLKEPLQRLEIADYLTDDRPFLILKMNDYYPTEAENRVLWSALEINKTTKFTVYSLPVSTLKSMHEVLRREVINHFDSLKLTRSDGFYFSDSLRFFHLFSFDKIPFKPALRGQGAFRFSTGEWKTYVVDTLSGVGVGKKITIGFWMYNYQKDGFVRSQLRIVHGKPGDDQSNRMETTDFFKHIKAYQGDWALIELDTEVAYKDEILELTVRNNIVPSVTFILDEIMIREKGLDVWQTGDKYLILNGRKFLRR